MKKKKINGIEITDETFKLVTEKEFNEILDSISKEEHELYTGYMEFQSWEDIDFIASYFTDDITDGKRFAMLSNE